MSSQFVSHRDANQKVWSEFVLDYVDRRVRRVLELLPRLGPEARYLDVGCGSGATTRRCAEAIGTRRVHGVDIALVDEARANGVAVLELDLNGGEPLAFAAGWFSVATCLETLEHVQDPDHLLGEIFRVLAPGATAVIDVPRLDSWMNVLLLALGYQPPGVECSTRRRYGAVNEGSLLTGHVSYFTRRAFREILVANGFVVDGLEQIGARSNWLAAQEKLGRRPGLATRLAWWLYDRLPGKKDYLVALVRRPDAAG